MAISAAQVASARHHHADNVPGRFDYYLLSLSWSPSFCQQQADAGECNGPRRYGIIVHGLWPQNERGWPEHCGDTDVPDAVADAVMDLMPARQLVYHEWAAHGTCSGLPVADFFALVRRARESIRVPESLQNARSAYEVQPSALANDFLQSNPRLVTDSVVATCSRQTEPRLREIHICFDRDLKSRACSTDVLQEACRAPSMLVPPVR